MAEQLQANVVHDVFAKFPIPTLSQKACYGVYNDEQSEQGDGPIQSGAILFHHSVIDALLR